MTTMQLHIRPTARHYLGLFAPMIQTGTSPDVRDGWEPDFSRYLQFDTIDKALRFGIEWQLTTQQPALVRWGHNPRDSEVEAMLAATRIRPVPEWHQPAPIAGAALAWHLVPRGESWDVDSWHVDLDNAQWGAQPLSAAGVMWDIERVSIAMDGPEMAVALSMYALQAAQLTYE